MRCCCGRWTGARAPEVALMRTSSQFSPPSCETTFRSSGHRRSGRRLSEQDLLSFFRDDRAVRVRLAFGIGTLRPGTLAHHVEPAPKVSEFVQLLLLTLPASDPGI